jgi:C4-dicarboxylate-specific signal transduction histidine kinase
VSAVVLIAYDLSAQREWESQLFKLEKLSALGDVAAGLTHELNQPLNTIKIIGQSILRDLEKGRDPADRLAADMGDVVRQVNRLAELVQHLRQFAKQNDRTFSTVIDVNSLVENVLRLTGQLCADHRIEVTTDLASPAPFLKGEPVCLEQALLNLLTNAREAVEKAAPERKRIRIKTSRNASSVLIEVTDNGVGLSEEIRGKIFQPLFTTKQTGGGIGLGLTIANKIVREHHGKIDFDANVAGETTFRIALPSPVE